MKQEISKLFNNEFAEKQFNKLMELSPDVRWIVVNVKDWKMPDEWKQHKNVFQETYEGMAEWINKQLTKSK